MTRKKIQLKKILNCWEKGGIKFLSLSVNSGELVLTIWWQF